MNLTAFGLGVSSISLIFGIGRISPYFTLYNGKNLAHDEVIIPGLSNKRRRASVVYEDGDSDRAGYTISAGSFIRGWVKVW